MYVLETIIKTFKHDDRTVYVCETNRLRNFINIASCNIMFYKQIKNLIKTEVLLLKIRLYSCIFN